MSYFVINEALVHKYLGVVVLSLVESEIILVLNCCNSLYHQWKIYIYIYISNYKLGKVCRVDQIDRYKNKKCSAMYCTANTHNFIFLPFKSIYSFFLHCLNGIKSFFLFLFSFRHIRTVFIVNKPIFSVIKGG